MGSNSSIKSPSYSITFAIYFLLYLAVYHKFIFSLEEFPIRDSFTYHYNSFHLFTNFIVEYGRPPEWFAPWGGWPIGLALPSFFFFLPYKLIGYAGGVTGIETLLLYKLSLAIGVTIVVTVWHRMLAAVEFNYAAAFCSSLCLLFGGLGLTVFHQDQVLATVFWYPFMFLAICLYRKKEVSSSAPLIFIGLLMSSHQPTIHLYSLLCILVLCFIYFRRDLLTHSIDALKRPQAIIWLAISVAPLLFLIIQVQGFISPFRINDIISASTYTDYLLLNTEQKSSAPLHYFFNYLWPGYLTPDTPVPGHDDVMNLSITRVGLILAFLGLVFNIRKSWKIIPLVLFLGWATMGIHGGLPRLLFYFDLPGIASFRQWYHFSSLFNLTLCVLVAYGADWIFQSGWGKKSKVIVYSLIPVLIAVDGSWGAKNYFTNFGPTFDTSSHKYLERMELSRFFSDMQYMQFFATEDSATFLRRCPRWHQKRAIILLAPELKSDSQVDCPSFPDKNKSIPVNYLPSGMELQVRTGSPSTIILPISNALVKTVTVNGVRTRFSNFNGLSSVTIRPGNFTIRATVDVLWQRIVIISQIVAMAWGMLSLFLRRKRRKQQPSIND